MTFESSQLSSNDRFSEILLVEEIFKPYIQLTGNKNKKWFASNESESVRRLENCFESWLGLDASCLQ